MKTADQILDTAAAHIGVFGWIQDAWWDADSGRPPGKCRVCANAAINLSGGYPPDYMEHDDADAELVGALVALARRVDAQVRKVYDGGYRMEPPGLVGAISEWNDTASRTRREVVDTLRAAARDLRERNGSAPAAPVEHRVEVGIDSSIQAASWGCSCGGAEVVSYARPGMGEVAALRLAGLKAERHVRLEAAAAAKASLEKGA